MVEWLPGGVVGGHVLWWCGCQMTRWRGRWQRGAVVWWQGVVALWRQGGTVVGWQGGAMVGWQGGKVAW